MIQVFEPDVGDAEIEAVAAALRRGELSGTFGESIPEFERSFAEYSDCEHGIAVSNGTTALHLAVAALGIGPGDEVLVSASTNIASALAVYHHGATVVPIDSEAVTWNLDLDLVEGLITDATRAVIAVHLFGHPVDMDRLAEIVRGRRIPIIEDAAEAHGAMVRGRKAGSLGAMGCFSFYANKVVTTGEGGMVTTNDDALAERLRLLRNLGFTTPRFRHDVAGYNFRMTGYQAAMGVVQTRRVESIIAGKRRVAAAYSARLEGIEGLQLPHEADWARNVYWMYGVVLDDRHDRDLVTTKLAADGVETRTFFCPMNAQPALQSRLRAVECPVADRLWRQGLYLPSSTLLTEAQIDRVATSLRSALGR